ncbi:alpha/beta hydrolase [Patiriisocius marinistellae]|uniref:Alpha/beta hydrolase n=1 Tax=Patiriisocius marinistellae TaxID=2494560 RepID=A0A5J4FW60_9FLAO|nr:alpha/beta hydrolase [Patiriisocius marinistellae]GEQ86977.1 alpha/beta hydrolase [Patiriisocius marinistellae]
MHYNTHTFTANDGEIICYYKWSCDSAISQRGIIQIAHGIGEHAGRYDTIAHRLQKEGFTVYANDHRAHGKTAEVKRLFGYYDGGDYFKDVVEDMHSLSQLMREENPNKKFILFGHSMGSLLSRKYVLKFGNEIDALILSGTANFIKGLGHFGLAATKAVVAIRGRERGNETLRTLFFDEFNKKFKPNRTKLDWISSDENAVDIFEADPYRIENFSLGVFADIISNSRLLNKKEAFIKTPDNLPILIFSGDKDPVGEMGKGVTKVAEKYKNNGNEDLTFNLYEDGRHEMLNETNSKEVEEDIITWLNLQIPK